MLRHPQGDILAGRGKLGIKRVPRHTRRRQGMKLVLVDEHTILTQIPDIERAIIRARRNIGRIRAKVCLQGNSAGITMASKSAKQPPFIRVIHGDAGVDVRVDEQEVLAVRGKLEGGGRGVGDVVDREFEEGPVRVLARVVELYRGFVGGGVVGYAEDQALRVVRDDW